MRSLGFPKVLIPTSMRQRRFTIVSLCALTCLTVLAYAISFRVGFVFDDTSAGRIVMRILVFLYLAAASRTAVSLSDGKIDLDYMVVDRKAGLVWVPAGGTGSVAIIDAKTLRVSKVAGFRVTKGTIGSRSFKLGPTAIALGDGLAYVGNRGDSTVCTIDRAALKRGTCVRLGPDLASSASSCRLST